MADLNRVFALEKKWLTICSIHKEQIAFTAIKEIILSIKCFNYAAKRRTLERFMTLLRDKKLLNLKLQYLYFQRLYRNIRRREQRKMYTVCPYIRPVIFLIIFTFFVVI